MTARRKLALVATALATLMLAVPAGAQTPEAPASADAIERGYGFVDPATGIWRLQTEEGPQTFYFGNPGDYPVIGDWNCDGIDTPGLYRQSDGYVYLRNTNTQGIADTSFYFGDPGDVPIAGDFDGDGCDTVSIYRPSQGRVYVIDRLGSGDRGLGAAEIDYDFGEEGERPIVADFDGDGVDTVAMHNPTSGKLRIRNTHKPFETAVEKFHGNPGDQLVAGKFKGQENDLEWGVLRPEETEVYVAGRSVETSVESDWVMVSGSFDGPTATASESDKPGKGHGRDKPKKPKPNDPEPEPEPEPTPPPPEPEPEPEPTPPPPEPEPEPTPPPPEPEPEPTPPPPDANGKSPLGTNLGLMSNYAEWAFIDTFKMSRPWVSGTPWSPTTTPVWDDGRPLDLDESGWVRSLLPDQVARTTLLWSPLPVRPAGRYVVLYDGQGTIVYKSGAQVVESGPGRDVVEIDGTSGIELNITETNPADYIRNIRVIMPGGTYADDPLTTVYDPDPSRTDYVSFEESYADLVFHPDFLKSLRGYSVVRFMNWQRTNHSTQSEWSGRPKPTDAQYTVAGAPAEVIADLANRAGVDPWINIPHLATDEYVREFAVIMRDRLDPGLVPYVEWSNEVWNSQFAQHTYVREIGVAESLDADPFAAAMKAFSRRSTETMQIWEQVFGSREFVAALSTKSTAPAHVSELLLSYGTTAAHTDLLSLGGYFGQEANWGNYCDQIAGMTLAEFFTFIRDVSLPRAMARLSRHVDVANSYGLRVGVYEGGQHFRQNSCAGDVAKRDAIMALFDGANTDARIGPIYVDFLRDYRAGGVDIFVHYINTGKWTTTERFGARQHLNQPRSEAPKYDALMDYYEEWLVTG